LEYDWDAESKVLPLLASESSNATLDSSAARDVWGKRNAIPPTKSVPVETRAFEFCLDCIFPLLLLGYSQ
jgi:hypothetical protein